MSARELFSLLGPPKLTVRNAVDCCRIDPPLSTFRVPCYLPVTFHRWSTRLRREGGTTEPDPALLRSVAAFPLTSSTCAFTSCCDLFPLHLLVKRCSALPSTPRNELCNGTTSPCIAIRYETQSINCKTMQYEMHSLTKYDVLSFLLHD